MTTFPLSRRALLLGSGASLLLAGRVSAAPKDDLALLTARVEDLRSIREIKRLQAEWGYRALAGDWKGMAQLGAPYIEMVLPEGNVVGREAMEQWLRDRMGKGVDGMPAGRLNLRLWFSPVVTLSAEGDRAMGRWHQIAMLAEEGGDAEWRGTTDVIEFHKTLEGWKIAHIRPYQGFAGPYATGWKHDAATLERAPYHYTPDEAGKVLTGRVAAKARPAGELAREASLLLGQSTALNLVNAFGYYLDRGMYDDILDLFAPIGQIDVAGQGIYDDAGGIRRFLRRFGAPGMDFGELNDRPQLMPLASIADDGRTALVRVIEIGMTGQHGGEGFWSAAVNTFLLVADEQGAWRIAQLHIRPLMRSDYKQGWADPLPAAMPLGAAMQADGPGQPVDTSYPEHPFQMQPLPSGVIYSAREPRGKVAIVEHALEKAEAFDGAENLSNAYGYYIDQFAWALTADLFARDGWKELSYIGTFIGKDRVRQSMIQRYGDNGANPAFQAIHQKTQPYVTVLDDGERAFVRNRLWQFNSSSTAQGSWIAGIYENQVKKEDGIWRIHGMDLDYTWLADYATGWTGIDPKASERFAPTPEQVTAFAPDAPLRGETFAPFPRIAPMGFLFANPVSGREPALRLHWSDGHREQ